MLIFLLSHSKAVYYLIAQSPSSLLPLSSTARVSSYIYNTPLHALSALPESSVDIVIECGTGGGERLYEACRAVLHVGGKFITCQAGSRKGRDKKGIEVGYSFFLSVASVVDADETNSTGPYQCHHVIRLKIHSNP